MFTIGFVLGLATGALMTLRESKKQMRKLRENMTEHVKQELGRL